MRRILLASDFSKGCDNALSYIINAVTNKRILIDIIHVYDIPLIDQSQVPYKAVEGMKAEKKSAVLRHIHERMDLVPPENRGNVLPVFGIYPSTEITEMADKTDVDLIVMALRKDYGMIDRMIGSITAHTIHKSAKPVMAIPVDSKFHQLQNILFPSTYNFLHDLSAKEEEALAWLYEFWEFFSNPQIHLVHINLDQGEDKTDVTFVGKPYTSMKFTLSGASTVHDGIKQVMEKEKPDLLAFFKPNRSFWERLYHRSETKKLLYESKIPLIVFG